MPNLPQPLLTLDHISFGGRIVQGASLSLYPGEVLCLVGKSGAGKSTLLRTAAGCLPPTKGRVLLSVDGETPLSLYDLPEQALVSLRRRRLGFVAQDARETLDLAASAAANIAQTLFDNGERHFGRALEAARHWFAALDLDEARMRDLPGVFSGGMQQRLQIARALVHEPDILFLDEPTTGLDTSAQARLLRLLSELQRRTGVAMLLVTHDLRIARLLAHRVIVLHEGRIVEEAPPDRLVTDPSHPASRDLVASMICVFECRSYVSKALRNVMATGQSARRPSRCRQARWDWSSAAQARENRHCWTLSTVRAWRARARRS